MKKLLTDLINQSGLNHQNFAKKVGVMACEISRMKRMKHIHIERLLDWMGKIGIEEIKNENVVITKRKQ